jgi:hypothetical protein
VKLYSRPGNDFTWRLPQIVETLARLRSPSCIIDGPRQFSIHSSECSVRNLDADRRSR